MTLLVLPYCQGQHAMVVLPYCQGQHAYIIKMLEKQHWEMHWYE